MPTALIRVTVRRVVEEIAQIDVREESPEKAALFVEADLNQKRGVLPTPDWQRAGVVKPPKAIAAEVAA